MDTMTERKPDRCEVRQGRLRYLHGLDPAYLVYEIWVGQFGALHCSMHQDSDWCEERATCVKDNDDAALLWLEDPERSPFLEIAVPIIPTKSQWAEVVGEFIESLGAFKCYLKPAKLSGWSGNYEDLTFIGFLNKGEGRGVLRTILLDSLMAELELPGGFSETMRCANPQHSFKAQMAFEHNTQKTKNGALAEMWSIMNTSNCITCSEGSVDDFDDLIPDVSKNPRKSW